MATSPAPIEQLAHEIVELGDPETALRALTAMRQELDALEPALVQRALRNGASWSEIARALGVSKQAAHRKHRRHSDTGGGNNSLETRLLISEDARRCIQFAREEANRLGRPAIATEHILLGILRCEETDAAKALKALRVTYRAAGDCLCTTMPGIPPNRLAQPAGDGLTSQARHVLEAARREASLRGDGYIGVEHILLALLTDSRNGAVQTLETLRAVPAKVRRALEDHWPAPALPRAVG